MHISPPPESEDVKRVYEATVASQGFLMNLVKAWAWRPDVYEGFAALRTQLMTGSALDKRDFAVLVSATASTLGDAYCSLAWGTILARQAEPSVAAAVLGGRETPAMRPRDLALARWARKVATDANSTSAEDVEDLRRAGLSERDILEATVFVAFRIAFSTVNDAIGAQPDWQFVEAAPKEVADAVTFGRAPTSKPQ